MLDASTLAAREILSESNLSKVMMRKLGCCQELEQSDEATFLGAADMERIVATWKVAIDRQSSHLVKNAASVLSDLPAGCLYDHLDDALWRKAAKICEIFRAPDVSKNAGCLDVRALQRHIHSCLMCEEPFTLVLGWGQPKRAAGGLKSLGAFADLAEMYALARLAIVTESASSLAERPIQLTVLTGGSRFFEALFTRPDLTATYDAQRQRIADVLFGPGVVRIRPYSDLFGEAGPSAVIGSRVERFTQALAAVTDHMIAARFGTILLNIDWDHVFEPEPDSRFQRPHGITMPVNVEKWLRGRDQDACNRLVRATIVGLINPKHQSDWLRTIDNEDVLEDALSFMQAVAWESTRKYIALHLMDANDETSSVLSSQGGNVLRLTVHEKNDRRDMPAIFTLGPKGGNLLSQHVMAVVGRSSIVFESFAELQSRDVVAVRLSRDVANATPAVMFGWLADTRQPLCFVDRTASDPVDLIAQVGGVV